jgi:two-component system nitrogen regulation response regulator NtrX
VIGLSRILVVDDVKVMREQYAYDLERLGGHETLTAAGGAEALQILEQEEVDCIILDLEMPGVDGFEVLRSLRRRRLSTPVIVYTGTGDFDRCVRAVRLGAHAFIDKEEPLERVVQEIENALSWHRLQREVGALRRRSGLEAPLVGSSHAMQSLREQIARLAPIASPVLVTGESGTGKELVARALHTGSDRARGPFIALNCAALPVHLVESELFGHERGAFTGADRARAGAFADAGGGTLLLDEIGELELPVQATLLRVLEERRVRRIGASATRAVDARVVAATNRDLEQEVAAGNFREDLLFRLNVHQLRVPALRERLQDIPELIAHFLDTICPALGTRPRQMEADVVSALARKEWRRNNVRELRNMVERLIIASDGEWIRLAELPARLRAELQAEPRAGTSDESAAQSAGSPAGMETGPGGWDRPAPLRELRAEAERHIILSALERNDWHITRTAAELGLADHASLLKIMRRHGLKRT